MSQRHKSAYAKATFLRRKEKLNGRTFTRSFHK